jgi:hypothetical protein
MERKVVLIILIVIAVVALLFLGVGLVRDGRDPEIDPKRYSPSSLLEWMDGLFAGSRDSLDLRRMDRSRMSGCVLTGRVLEFSGQCDVVIDTAKTKSSAFVLVRGVDQADACFAFTLEDLNKCWIDSDKRGPLKKARTRFIVTRDGAFLRLQCLNSGNRACRLTVE